MKKIFILAILILVILGYILFNFDFFSEDNYVRDSKGIWIKKGNPKSTPLKVMEQEMAIICSQKLYNDFKKNNITIVSQCLGSCLDYSVDFVNVPKNEEDYLIENQCEDYRKGVKNKFIEIDKNGVIVRIVD